MQLVVTFISAIASFFIGVFVLKNNRKSFTNLLFAVLCFSLGLWAISNFISLEDISRPAILFWMRLVMALAVVQSISFFLFIHTFPNEKIKLKKKFLIPLIIVGITTIIIAFTPLLFEDVNLEDGSRSPVVAPGMLLFLITAVGSLLFGFILLIKRLRKEKGITKVQFKYILIGTLLMFVSILVFNFILVVIFKITTFVNWAPFFVLPFIFFTTYTITKHRFMDIRIVLRKSMVMAAVLVTIVGGAGIITYANAVYWELMRPMWMGMLTMTVGLVLYDPIKEKYLKFANNYFFTSLHTYQKAIEKVTSDLTSTIEIEKIIHSIIDSITKAMGLEKVCVLTIKHYDKDRYSFDIEKASGFNEGDIAKIIKGELLVNYFKEHKKILVVEEVLREMEEHKEKKNYYTKIERLEENLKKLDVSICLPLFAKGKLNGMIILGNKISKDAYTVQDLELLKTMGDQAAVAMENAQLYEKVQDLNINLQKKVEEATVEIKEKNEDLKELLEMKSDFLTVASHQLRTPTSIVRGMLSMLNEDTKKMSPKAQKDFISQAYGAANNLEHIINDLLSATELEGGKVEYNIEPLDALEIVGGVIKERGFMAKEKKLKLKLFEPKKKLPMVLADSHKLKEVVNNLVDNAIYYTDKGTIEVGFKPGKGELQIYVKDQGIGLSPEDKDKIFGRFIRGDRSLSVNPNGTGLGLYIVDQCIQAMNGKVIAESEGINKGTTFSIFLPSLIE